MERMDGIIEENIKSFSKGFVDIQSRIAELEEENKKLKSDLAYERTMLDNVKAEYKSLQNVNKKLKERIEALELCIDID